MSGVAAEKIRRRGEGYEIVLANKDAVSCDRVICSVDPVGAARSLFDEDVLPESFLRKLRSRSKYPVITQSWKMRACLCPRRVT